MTTPNTPEKTAPSHAEHAEHAAEGEIPRDLPKPGPVTIIFALLLAIGLLIGLYYLGLKPHKITAEDAKADVEERSTDKPVVGVTPPKLAAAVREVSLPGDVRPFQETSIFPRANGYLKTLKHDINDRVGAGELLAEVDTPDITAQIAQAAASLDQANANVAKSQTDVELAKRTVDRYEGARKESSGTVSDQQLDEVHSTLAQANNAFAVAQANVAVAQANVNALHVTEGFNKITSPFAGTITARNFDVGALLSPTTTTGREIFRLSQTDVLKVIVNVPQPYATNLKMGQDVFLSVKNYPDKEFKGKVARTAGTMDPGTRTLLVESHFPNPDGVLLAGMYGQIRLPIQDDRPALLLPSSALIFDAGGLRVATVADGKVKYKKITVGRDLGTQLEITSGIAADDQVVTNPGERIHEGVEVTVHPADK